MDWLFRITTGSVADFAADLNGFCAANGYAPISPDGKTIGNVTFQDVSRFDFDIFDLPSGKHVNARATTLPGADATKTAAVLDVLDRQLRAYFGAVQSATAYPVAPALASVTNLALGVINPLQIGGQVWKSTGKTVLIDPPPTIRKRVWA